MHACCVKNYYTHHAEQGAILPIMPVSYQNSMLLGDHQKFKVATTNGFSANLHAGLSMCYEATAQASTLHYLTVAPEDVQGVSGMWQQMRVNRLYVLNAAVDLATKRSLEAEGETPGKKEDIFKSPCKEDMAPTAEAFDALSSSFMGPSNA